MNDLVILYYQTRRDAVENSELNEHGLYQPGKFEGQTPLRQGITMTNQQPPARHQWYEGHPCLLPPARPTPNPPSETAHTERLANPTRPHCRTCGNRPNDSPDNLCHQCRAKAMPGATTPSQLREMMPAHPPTRTDETVIRIRQDEDQADTFIVAAKGRRTRMDRAGVEAMLHPLLLLKYPMETIDEATPEDGDPTGYAAGIRYALDTIAECRHRIGWHDGIGTAIAKLEVAAQATEPAHSGSSCFVFGCYGEPQPGDLLCDHHTQQGTPTPATDPPLPVRARNAALDAATYAEAWFDTMKVADIMRRRRAMRMTTKAAYHARLAAETMDKAMAAAGTQDDAQ